MLTVCRQPLYGGAGLYLFGYLFLYGNPVEGHDFFLRIMEMLAGFLICGTVFWVKHHEKKDREPFSKLLKQFSIFDQVGRWQVQVTLGVVLGIFIGELLHMERLMWMGCSCLTVLSQYGEEPKKKGVSKSWRCDCRESSVWDFISGMARVHAVHDWRCFRFVFGALRGIPLENTFKLLWRADYGVQPVWGRDGDCAAYCQ